MEPQTALDQAAPDTELVLAIETGLNKRGDNTGVDTGSAPWAAEWMVTCALQSG